MLKVLFFLLFCLGLKAQQFAIPEPVVCKATEMDAFTRILRDASNQNLRRVPTSDIQATFVGFPKDAQSAFERAIGIWEEELISSVPIRIKATWEAIDGNTLAYSGASRIYRSVSGAPYDDVWYFGPLAESIAGRDLNDGDFDINITLNSQVKWSYDVEGQTFSGRYDLVTVVLHEIAHGLGFSSSFKLSDDNQSGVWGQNEFPMIYDIFVQSGTGATLIDDFSNSSADLKNQLTSEKLLFELSNDLNAKLHSPKEFKEGASIAHLDSDAYPSGSSNSLMAPSIHSAEVNHQPGDVVLNMLHQMGWALNNNGISNVLALEEEQPKILVYPNPFLEEIVVAIPINLRREFSYFSLWSLEGKELMKFSKNTLTEPNVELSLDDYVSGVYLLMIATDTGRFVKRIVKY